MEHHVPINTSKEPIRLFQNNFLEFFTHISPITVVIIWLPVALGCLIAAILRHPGGTPITYIPAGFLSGLFLWTLAEYLLHRFVFHFPPRTPGQERITFLFHGIHHAQPQVKTRLVMPPVVSIPLALLFYGLFTLILGTLLGKPHWVWPLFSGYTTGYLIYDLTHYASHHFKMKGGYAEFIKRYHYAHHYRTPNARFGVSSPLWDYVFGTYPRKSLEK
jgi:sterol desaturase/sphingolipid hydroxylase (fatty acid hydroxylase superfamily)